MAEGLFGGMTAPQAQLLMQQERDAKLRAAMQGASNSGAGFQASLAMRNNESANQNMQALGVGLRKAFEGLGGAGSTSSSQTLSKVPNFLGMQQEDPRLVAARKRDKDRGEINKMMEAFKADDGVVTEQEMQQGFSELIARGYVPEAIEFLKMAQSMATVDTNRIKANAALQKSNALLNPPRELKNTVNVGTFKDETGRTFTKLLQNYKVGPPEEVYVAHDGTKGTPPQGTVSPVGSQGLTTSERVSEAGEIRETEKFVDTKTSIAESLQGNMETLRASNEMLRLLPTIKTGGFAAMTKNMTDFFGVTAGNVGNFNTLAGRKIVSQIRQFGSQPTEGERKFLEAVEAGMNQGKNVNEAILKDLVKMLEAKVSRESKYLSPGFTAKDYQKALSEKGQQTSENTVKIMETWEKPVKVTSSTDYDKLLPGMNYIPPGGTAKDAKVKQ